MAQRKRYRGGVENECDRLEWGTGQRVSWEEATYLLT